MQRQSRCNQIVNHRILVRWLASMWTRLSGSCFRVRTSIEAEEPGCHLLRQSSRGTTLRPRCGIVRSKRPYLNWEDSLPNMRYQNPHSGQRLRMGLAINFYFDPLLPNKVRKSLTFVGGFGKIGSGRLRARCSGRQRSSLTSPVRQNGSTMNTIVARYRTR